MFSERKSQIGVYLALIYYFTYFIDFIIVCFFDNQRNFFYLIDICFVILTFLGYYVSLLLLRKENRYIKLSFFLQTSYFVFWV